MSKTTKIVAALGIVAGLGVAALPAFTYAAQTPQHVTGDVDLYVEVQPAIAMTITGNNDADQSYTYTSYKYTIVTPGSGDNPSEKGWYEKNGDTYTESTDTAVAQGKIYFMQEDNTEGVDVFAPTIGSGTATVDRHSEAFKVGPSSSYLNILPNASGTMTSDVTVYTNNASGYTLQLKDADNDTNLTKIYSGTTPADPAVIAASATPAPGNDAGWSVTGGNSAFQSGAAITAANQTVKTFGTKTNGGDLTQMTYTVATAADQETGVYTDTITYTATTNN